MRLLLFVGCALVLSGCSMSLPVRGLIQNSTETLAGSARGRLDGSGDLTLTTSSGVACRGQFVYVSRRAGQGSLQCADGRSGSFQFAAAGLRATGSGVLGNQGFTFTFGP